MRNTKTELQQTISFDYLDWRKRPETVTNAVNVSYTSLVHSKSSSNWLYNGAKCYPFGGIDQFHFIQNMINAGYPEQTEYFIMDIGAGEFQWGRAIAEHINNCHFPDDISVHIYSLRGEQNNESQEFKKGICVLHEIGSCKIEELEAVFSYLNNKIDFIISSWCFRHLADPVGTFVQAHNLLKPLTGFFLFDGFFMGFSERYEAVRSYEDWTSEQHYYFTRGMDELLINTGSAYVKICDLDGRRHNAFVLQKKDFSQLKLPLNYIGCDNVENLRIQCSSNAITKFVTLPRWKKFDSEEMMEEIQINDGRYNHSFYLNSHYTVAENKALLALLQPSVSRVWPSELAKQIILRRGKTNSELVKAANRDNVSVAQLTTAGICAQQRNDLPTAASPMTPSVCSPH